MKIGDLTVKRNYTIPQIISDVFSLVVLLVIIQIITVQYQVFNESIPIFINSEGLPTVFAHKSILLISPILAVFICGLSVALCYIPMKMPKNYIIDKNNAGKYYEIIITAIGLVRIVILLALFEILYLQCEIGLARNPGFSLQLVLDIILIMIIIRFTYHRLRQYKKKAHINYRKNND